MPKLVTVEAIYWNDPDELFTRALDFKEVDQAMAGFASYERGPEQDVFEGQKFDVIVTFWGWFKNPPHTIYVEKVDRENRVIQSREHSTGNGIKRWDHTLQIFPHEKGARWVMKLSSMEDGALLRLPGLRAGCMRVAIAHVPH